MAVKKKSKLKIRLPESSQAMRLSGLIAPFIFLIYFILIVQRFIKVQLLLNPIVPVITIALWIIIGIFQYARTSQSKLEVAIRLVFYHFFAFTLLTVFDALISPLIVLWLLLISACYIYFSIPGVILNIIAFIILVITNIFINNYGSPEKILSSSLIALGILATSSLVILAFHYINKSSLQKIAQSKAKEDLQKDRIITIVNNLSDALISINQAGIINTQNSAIMSLLNTNRSLVGKNICDVLPLKDLAGNDFSILNELQVAKKNNRRDDLLYYFPDGDKIRLEITYSPIRKQYHSKDQKITEPGYILILRDVTKQKNLEEEQDEFISVMGHELRTPVAVAEGTIANIQAILGNPNATPELIASSIDTAHKHIVSLAGVINDLTTLSRLDSQSNSTKELINALDFMTELHNKYSAEIAGKGLAFDLDISPNIGKLSANRQLLEQLLQILLNNAMKYTKKGGIKLSLKKKEDNKIIFSVIDTGIGISRSDQKRIFDKFFRGEDYRIRETGGTGLGLYIAERLARKLGTNIELTSRLNYGSTFSFILRR